jgi:hypothetical protein
MPNAFLLLCKLAHDSAGTAVPKITLFHRLAQYTARQGLPVEWDDMAFAFKGDVNGPQADIPSVIWSQDYFRRTNQLRVCTQLVHDQALAADPTVTIVGPFDANEDAGTEVRRIRRCAYVPPKYIGMFLEQDLTPREACKRCCAAIERDGLAAELEDLCFWLRAAMTCQVAGANSPLVVDHPLAPIANHLLSSHRRQLLFLDLPALSSTSVGQGAQLIAVRLEI